ncbi:acyl-CoA thioesterase II [Mycobacterium alsense]|uniref:Acyl-CoA thioesterase II n=1 Tax=Mycobacterium alsense TaxID=324058 RepID=A0ABD6NUY4_9MYCO|nr:acyl-CoA thioesterase domain-containing protein [Mycobacterium alsense]OBG28482.1 acyl-CoA thioesterase II [Mycobacterium alsense]
MTIEEECDRRAVAELLRLIPVAPDRFLAPALGGARRRPLYGGQVAAQALRAASLTVPDGRVAHSIHGYFLQPGDASRPVALRVERDRDGGSYSARRVTATQADAVIFSMACSFARGKNGAGFQATTMPAVPMPAQLKPYRLDVARAFDVEARVPLDDQPWYRWPARLWLRIREPLDDDPNVQACGVVFLSDLCTGLSRAPRVEQAGLLPSLDHAVWLHRGGRADDWLLVDLMPLATGGGRGVYTGRIYDRSGTLVASLAQESLFDTERGEVKALRR